MHRSHSACVLFVLCVAIAFQVGCGRALLKVGSGGGSGGGAPLADAGLDASDPDGGDLDGGMDAGPPTCAEQPGEGDTLTFVFTAMTLPAGTSGHQIGFDLDDHVSTSSDPEGCFRSDHAGGIDNAFSRMYASLNQMVESASNFEFETLNEAIEDAIFEEQFVVTVTVRGYDGSGDDACVAVDVDLGIPGGVQGIEATVEAGILEVELGDFVFPLSMVGFLEDRGGFLDLAAFLGRMTLDLEGGTGILGGVFDRGGEVFDASGGDAPEGTLHRELYDFFVAVYGFDPPPNVLINGANNSLNLVDDFDPPSGEPECTAVSFGFSFEVAPAP